METIKAWVVEDNDEHIIRIGSDSPITIPLSKDDPNEVKRAFNRLIERLRSGEIRIEIEEVGEDLFSQVADEYVKQLNKEMTELHDEMVRSGLIKE